MHVIHPGFPSSIAHTARTRGPDKEANHSGVAMRSWKQSVPLPCSPVAQHTGCIHCTALSETTAGCPSNYRFRKPQADCQQHTPRRREPCSCLIVSHILDTVSLPPRRGSPFYRRKTGFLSCKDNKQNMHKYLCKTKKRQKWAHLSYQQRDKKFCSRQREWSRSSQLHLQNPSKAASRAGNLSESTFSTKKALNAKLSRKFASTALLSRSPKIQGRSPPNFQDN